MGLDSYGFLNLYVLFSLLRIEISKFSCLTAQILARPLPFFLRFGKRLCSFYIGFVIKTDILKGVVAYVRRRVLEFFGPYLGILWHVCVVIDYARSPGVNVDKRFVSYVARSTTAVCTLKKL